MVWPIKADKMNKVYWDILSVYQDFDDLIDTCLEAGFFMYKGKYFYYWGN